MESSFATSGCSFRTGCARSIETKTITFRNFDDMSLAEEM